MAQNHNYWTKHSYIAIESTVSELVKQADSLLPDTYCIVKVEDLSKLDQPKDLADRLSLAESEYHKLAQYVNDLKERFNINE